jgi:hypothetical protein
VVALGGAVVTVLDGVGVGRLADGDGAVVAVLVARGVAGAVETAVGPVVPVSVSVGVALGSGLVSPPPSPGTETRGPFSSVPPV